MQNPRKLLWISWVLSTATAVATIVMLILTFSNLAGAKNHKTSSTISSAQFNSALAGCILSTILLILLHTISFFVLLRSTTWAMKRNSASLPFISSSFLHVALFTLLNGLILTADASWTDNLTTTTTSTDTTTKTSGWTSGDATVMTATYILCFVTTGVDIYMCVAFIFFHRYQHQAASSLYIDSDLEMALANLGSTNTPLSSDGSVRIQAVRAPPPPSETPSDSASSVAATRKATYGAWGRSGP